MVLQADLDNQLVHQKDKLLDIVGMNSIPHMKRALAGLELVREMWLANSYGYKINEILARIEIQAADRLAELPKQERKIRQQLDQIRAVCALNRVEYDDLI